MIKQAFTPVLPSWEYVPDVEPRVFDGRLYLYGSHDRFNGEEFCLNDYVAWSAPVNDLSSWQFEGTIYCTGDDPLNSGGGQTGFAPDCIQGPDGRYYLFYCLSRTPYVSVAVSDTPAGKFDFYGHIKTPEGKNYGGPGSVFCFDPGVLMDEDGRIWLYTGFAPEGQLRQLMQMTGMQIDGCYCAELSGDMLTLKGEPVMVAPCADIADGTGFQGHAFYEAASPRKIGGYYYLIYSSQLGHELCYATSSRPDGGFTYGGTIISNGDVGLAGSTDAVNYTGNNHGGMAEIGGQWYIFYHRQTNLKHFSRQCCAEPVVIGADGKIAQVEMTSCGLNGSPLKAVGRYEARIACNLSSAQGTFFYDEKDNTDGTHPYFTQSGSDREEKGDQYIANMQDGSWAGFKYFAFTGGENWITLCLRGNFKGKVIVSSKRDGEPLAEIMVMPSAEWTLCSTCMKPVKGVYPVYLVCHGTGALDISEMRIE